VTSQAAAKELLEKINDSGNLRVVPITVVTTSPFVVTINGANVSAVAMTGMNFTVAGTGYALYAPPLLPLCFTTGAAAEDDTGWVNLAYQSGYTNANGQAEYRQIGNRVWIEGAADRTAGDFTTTAVTVATIPAAARPENTQRYASYGTGGRLGRVEINTGGDINIAVPNLVNSPDEPFGWLGISHTYLTD
jgi:hypothetical protein